MATVEEQIKALYQEELGRAADDSGLQYYLDQVSSGGKSLAQVAADLNASSEGMSYDTSGSLSKTAADTIVRDVYQQELGRQAEQGGYDFYVNELLSGGKTYEQMLNEVNMSEEGRLIDPTEQLAAGLLYQGLTPDQAQQYIAAGYDTELGRGFDQSGMDYYLNQVMNDPTQTIATMLQSLNRSEEGVLAEGLDPDTGKTYVFNRLTGDPVQLSAQDQATFDQWKQAKAEGLVSGQEGMLGALTSEGLYNIVSPFTNIYRPDLTTTDDNGVAISDATRDALQVFANRTKAIDMGIDVGDSPWSGNPYEYLYDSLLGEQDYFSPDYKVGGAESNYGMFGKRPDETLTEYYTRLERDRQGGILGQGMLSASPTVGSDAYKDIQTLAAVDPEAASKLVKLQAASTMGGEGMLNTPSNYDYGQMSAGMENFLLGVATSDPRMALLSGNPITALLNLTGRYAAGNAIDNRMDAIQNQIDTSYNNQQNGIYTVVDSSGNVSNTYSPSTFPGGSNGSPAWDNSGNVYDGGGWSSSDDARTSWTSDNGITYDTTYD